VPLVLVDRLTASTVTPLRLDPFGVGTANPPITSQTQLLESVRSAAWESPAVSTARRAPPMPETSPATTAIITIMPAWMELLAWPVQPSQPTASTALRSGPQTLSQAESVSTVPLPTMLILLVAVLLVIMSPIIAEPALRMVQAVSTALPVILAIG
jgi:hypothetical protein